MIKELRQKTDNELGELIAKLKVQLLETRFKMANGELENIHKRKEIKKTIAMAMTVLSERNIKISFSTFDTQLIKSKDGKQQIITISRFDKSKQQQNDKQKNQNSSESVSK